MLCCETLTKRGFIILFSGCCSVLCRENLRPPEKNALQKVGLTALCGFGRKGEVGPNHHDVVSTNPPPPRLGGIQSFIGQIWGTHEFGCIFLPCQ